MNSPAESIGDLLSNKKRKEEEENKAAAETMRFRRREEACRLTSSASGDSVFNLCVSTRTIVTAAARSARGPNAHHRSGAIRERTQCTPPPRRKAKATIVVTP
jgi:hypothetical protein